MKPGAQTVQQWLEMMGVAVDASDAENVAGQLSVWLERWQALKALLMAAEPREM